ncbi:MAG: TPM domain-containing protein [Pseudomonadales bacterium]
MIRPVWALVLALCCLSFVAQAAPQFPKLSGRIVDSAGMIDAATEARLNEYLAGHERASGHQIVVVTLEQLDGYDIADYGYQLGRHWGIGQKDKNTGALLIVAKAERKVRIEVGYGLEGQLTDALSSNIIQSIVVPAFKRGQFSKGIAEGAVAIVEVLGGEYQPRQVKQKKKQSSWFPLIIFIIILLSNFGGMFFGGGGRGRRRRGGAMFIPGAGGFSGGGGFGGGGFSGGGGGFGGGGASGGW